MAALTDRFAQSKLPASVRRGKRRWLSLVVLLAVCLGLALTMLLNSHASSLETHAQARPLRSSLDMARAEAPGGDFSQFAHTKTHARLPCLLCHRRDDNSPPPRLPGPTPCARRH